MGGATIMEGNAYVYIWLTYMFSIHQRNIKICQPAYNLKKLSWYWLQGVAGLCQGYGNIQNYEIWTVKMKILNQWYIPVST
jgi:hypothetical protein